MIGISPRTAPSLALLPTTTTAVIAHGETASLLPDPEPPTPAGAQDAMATIYALLTRLDASSTQSAMQGVAAQTAARNEALKQEQDALGRQEQAQKDQAHAHHGFLHTLGIVGKVVGVVAAAAASVVTFGAAAPALAVAVVALSVGGMVLEETNLGGAVGKWVGLGMAIASSVCTLGATSGSAIAQGLSAAGDVASGTGAVADAAQDKKASDAAARADDAAADGMQANQHLTQHEEVTQELLDVLKQVHKSHQGALESLQGAMQINGQISVGISAQMGKA